MRFAWWILPSLLAACGGTGPRPAPSLTTVVVPAADQPAGAGEESLPGRQPEPPPPPDPLEYYIGTWDGMINDTVRTELVISQRGRFVVRASATPHRSECELSGRFRAAEDTIWMEVQQTSCDLLTRGTTLERRVIDKSKDHVTVQSLEGDLVIVYTRRL
jgi:hypothetical protein